MNVNAIAMAAADGRLDLTLARRAAAEGIAAFALVFAGCGAIVANAQYDGALGAVGISLVVRADHHGHGLRDRPPVRRAHQPGGDARVHAHPPLPGRDAAAYIGAQLIGATAGALALLAVWTDKPGHLGATVPSVGVGSALVYELCSPRS